MKYLLYIASVIFLISCGEDLDMTTTTTETEDPIELEDLRITGSIKDENRNPIPNAGVVLAIDRQLADSKFADENGNFEFVIAAEDLDKEIVFQGSKDTYSSNARTAELPTSSDVSEVNIILSQERLESNGFASNDPTMVKMTGKFTDTKGNPGWGAIHVVDLTSGGGQSFGMFVDDKGEYEIFVRPNIEYGILFWTRCETELSKTWPQPNFGPGPKDAYGYYYEKNTVKFTNDTIFPDYVSINDYVDFRINGNVIDCRDENIEIGELIIEDFVYSQIPIINGRIDFNRYTCACIPDELTFRAKNLSNGNSSEWKTTKVDDSILNIGEEKIMAEICEGIRIYFKNDSIVEKDYIFTSLDRDNFGEFRIFGGDGSDALYIRTSADGIGEFSLTDLQLYTVNGDAYKFSSEGPNDVIINFNEWNGEVTGGVNSGNIYGSFYNLSTNEIIQVTGDFTLLTTSL